MNKIKLGVNQTLQKTFRQKGTWTFGRPDERREKTHLTDKAAKVINRQILQVIIIERGFPNKLIIWFTLHL